MQPLDRNRLSPLSRLSRRAFLRASGLTVVGGSIALAGCGSSSNAQTSPTLVQLFSGDRVIGAGTPQRISFGLIDDGQSVLGEGEQNTLRILLDGEVFLETAVQGRVVNHDHVGDDGAAPHEHANILRYYALEATLPTPGIYDLEMDTAGGTGHLPFQVFDHAEVKVIQQGERFPELITPTPSDTLGVDPLCTLRPEPCGFHAETAADIAGAGRPLALLVSTPAFCATAYCGPVLETLIDASSEFGSIGYVHVEVYGNASALGGNLADPDLELSPALAPLGLEFEPSFFAVDSSGVLQRRIDNVFDRAELVEALRLIA